MKKLFFIMLTCLPVMAIAQNVWEKPQQEVEEQTKTKDNKQKIDLEDTKYITAKIPMVDGKVVFSMDTEVLGKSAQQIYDIVYAKLNKMAKEDNQLPESNVALVNKKDYIIAARFSEWLVFSNSLLSLDRTKFNYTIIAKCSDGHLNMKLERINYVYEEDRSAGFKTSAEEWITDKYALNKKRTKLSKISGKFRRKTLDRVENIFITMSELVKK